MSSPKPGTIGWMDITVDDADSMKSFYSSVAGWSAEGCDVGGYEDYNMSPPAADGEEAGAIAGVCWRKGPNVDIPKGWMMYVVVEDIDAAEAAVAANGGVVLARKGNVVVARDPEGNAFSLWGAPKKS